MNVRPTEERYCYQVESETKAGRWYRVDLTANFGGGECSCTDWSTRRQPRINTGEPILHREQMCKHVRAALWHFIREVMPMLAEQEQATPKPSLRNTPLPRQSERPASDLHRRGN